MKSFEFRVSSFEFPKIVYQALAIVILASILGIGSNLIRRERIPFISHKTDFVKEEKKGNAITLEEAKERFDNGTGFFVDARSGEEFLKGHILNAYSLPEEVFAERIDEVKITFPDSEEFAIIVYCGGEECDASTKLAEQLRQSGYANVRVFFGGWNEWVRAGYPVEGTPS
ncbi:MAG: rhodanese-like domain-containing protein [Proteobacteria bacterium]|nr:rhodanese-like domain-containing protein [Pseudomonadota bacterium]